jgi:endogenous inhibitor of DNA gyrase (YacG/DUF329 family)
MAEPKTVYCPICNRKVTKWDGKSSINPMGKCTNCGKIIVYKIETEEIEIKAPKERMTSSGVRFY